MSANFDCNLTGPSATLPHCWEHTVGSDHALMALRADWQAQLRKAHDELGFRHVRFHGILDDDVGTLVCERDGFIYSFFNGDQIFDFLLSIGMKPFVELSFMPGALASDDTTVFKYRGNITPPKDYTKWGTFISKLVSHWVERYGLKEVRQWFFEVWNEPNLKTFWTGEQADYFKLYKSTALAIKTVDPKLRIGGPATADNAWIGDFIGFCETNNIPPDFVSTHHYPTDAFGEPGDDTETQLSKSRRSVLREEAQGARALARDKPLYYTEWSSSSNPRDPLHDEAYAAAFAIKTNLEAAGLVEGYSYWTFSDIFEENYFPSTPFHGGFGLLNLYGIAKPTYRAYQLLYRLGNKRLTVNGIHSTVDVWVIKGEDEIAVYCTNWSLPRHPIANEQVCISLSHAPPPAAATITRIDATHANVKKAWARMGAPEYLLPTQVRQLHAASELKPDALRCQYADNIIRCEFTVPPQAVAAVAIELKSRRKPRHGDKQHNMGHSAETAPKGAGAQ
jgi:xylan 1,4-beta-xylosidase